MKYIVNGKIIMPDNILENKALVYDNKIIDIIEYSKSSCIISDLYLKDPFKYHGYYYTRISYDKYYILLSLAGFCPLPPS